MPAVKPLLIVKTGTTVPAVAERRGDFEDWFCAATGVPPEQSRVVRVFEGEALPDPREARGVIVTGSAAMVTDHEEWSDRTAEWLGAMARDTDVPLLAVCYGHQLLAQGLGGRVDRNPRGREIGTIEVELLGAAGDDALFGEMPRPMRVQATHLESVVELPADVVRLAQSARDPNQAFRARPFAWGVQFHPELDADVVRGYIAARREQIRGEGLDPEGLEAAATDTDDGRRLLRQFAALRPDG